MWLYSIGHWYHPVPYPTEEALLLHAVGRPADVGHGHHRHGAVPHAFLATPNSKPQPADYPVQSPTLVFPLARYQGEEDTLLANHCHLVNFVPDGCFVPVVCRGYLVFGIVFAAAELAAYER